MEILLTGPNGYIAGRLAAAFTDAGHGAQTVGVRGGEWRGNSFGGFGAVVHTAAVVHRKRAPSGLYRAVNTDLTLALAQKAKRDGAGQFIFLSTMAVYGAEASMDGAEEITPETPCRPVTPYGASKLEAERGLAAIAGGGFKVCVLRPPIVYGPDCPGNYRSLRALALRSPAVPRMENRRGMVYIGHLCELTLLLAGNRAEGVFFPQDAETVSTGRLMRWIREARGLETTERAALDAPIRAGARVLPPLRKAFGSLAYRPDMTVCAHGDYRKLSAREAVALTEAKWGSCAPL